MSDLISLPYRLNPAKCCEKCAFGTGIHQPWCERKRYNVVNYTQVFKMPCAKNPPSKTPSDVQ